jgi:hypothetical protein
MNTIMNVKEIREITAKVRKDNYCGFIRVLRVKTTSSKRYPSLVASGCERDIIESALKGENTCHILIANVGGASMANKVRQAIKKDLADFSPKFLPANSAFKSRMKYCHMTQGIRVSFTW